MCLTGLFLGVDTQPVWKNVWGGKNPQMIVVYQMLPPRGYK